jgi:hypothetical protein
MGRKREEGRRRKQREGLPHEKEARASGEARARAGRAGELLSRVSQRSSAKAERRGSPESHEKEGGSKGSGRSGRGSRGDVPTIGRGPEAKEATSKEEKEGGSEEASGAKHGKKEQKEGEGRRLSRERREPTSQQRRSDLERNEQAPRLDPMLRPQERRPRQWGRSGSRARQRRNRRSQTRGRRSEGARRGRLEASLERSAKQGGAEVLPETDTSGTAASCLCVKDDQRPNKIGSHEKKKRKEKRREARGLPGEIRSDPRKEGRRRS